ncbi:amino acid/amide ABC transporter substrate-binding protein, haat family [Halogeometricum borinquense DSM 11551]|uniref:amino acid/amide ABC transporter substrate-binding protein, HAAT family n=2 Tax=Halogeometricum borinquense TaxID=60847 RepID=E4NTK3_HALBP|nr:ABC transporter substrate-binding protein [Halogeometricum borinquense]ADQ67055.1 amino acid/amide ABC transporter substrate-binding protein, HAAT family [Halogeometricum borinquense DSM 11551]ELY29602.1 amino acid/amide ABC transporter substrate-binding protein, haat family [Halogeometricum borinquense DSM 11551]
MSTDDRISRRSVLSTLGAAGVTGFAGCAGGDNGGTDQTTTGTDGETMAGEGDATGTTTGSAGGASGTVKLGVIQPMSTDLKYYGMQALWGFFSGMAYKGDTDPVTGIESGEYTVSVGGVDYELYVRDTKFSADTAQTLATDLVQSEDVDMLVGCASSGAASRVITTVAKQANVPYMVGPAASADITGNSKTCGDMIFRAAENTAMDARSGGKYVAQETDVQQVYLFGADYSFGRAVVNNYESVLKANNVEIVGKKFVQQGYSEWKGLLDKASEAGAQGIVGGFTVSTLPALFTTYLNGDYNYRVFGGFATEITTSVVGQTLQKVFGKPLTEQKLQGKQFGPFTTRYHWNQYDNDINSAFVDMYSKAYGRVPDLFTSGMFTAASAIVQAVEESGSTEGADIASSLRGMTVAETPKGTDGYAFQKYNNQARSAMTVADPVPITDEWKDQWGAAIMPSDPVARIDASETTIPSDAEEMGCSL